jgi:putative DNA primase/helicase
MVSDAPQDGQGQLDDFVNSSTTDTALATALACHAANISSVPVRCDGSKAPDVLTWDPYKERLPTLEEILAWYRTVRGVAVVCGAVSGNLFVVDSEYPDLTADWCELVGGDFPGLIESLPHVRTPGRCAAGADHFYGRSPQPLPTSKLAHLTADEALARTGDEHKRTAIEIKAEGGYVLAPGCPGGCHESGRLYRHVGGPFIEDVPTLTQEQVDALLDAARALNQVPAVTAEYHGSTAVGDGTRPGDVFNRLASWGDVLTPHGWVLVRVKGETGFWRRPGKSKGVSATTGYCHNDRSGDLLCVFSTNAAPLDIPDGQDHRCFSKFSAYTLLNYKGDFKAAARELAGRGYRLPSAGPRSASHALREVRFTVRIRGEEVRGG